MSIRPFRDIKRKKTKVITVGNVKIGGDHPISVQSMTNTLTQNVPATIKQINDYAKKNSLSLELAAKKLIELNLIKPKTKIGLSSFLNMVSKWRNDLTIKKMNHVKLMQMIIDESGQVGIGADPASILHVSSGTSGDCELIVEADTDNNDENDSCSCGLAYTL